MTAEILKAALDVLKLAPRYLVAIGLVLTCLLFTPAHLLKIIGIADIAKDYRTGIGIGFVCVIALLCVGISGWAFQLLRSPVSRWQFKRHIRQCMGRLTEDEKQILRFYIVHQTRTNKLRIDDGVVQGLADKRIIWRASNMGDAIEGFAYNMSEVAWDVLNEQPAILNGTTNTYRTHQRHNGR